MTTPDQLGRKFDQLGRDLTHKIPAQGTVAGGAIVFAAAVAGANRANPPGGSQIKLLPPRSRFGNANTVVVGYGFAVLAEHGSWRKPDGWDIFPKGLTKSLKVGIKSGRSREGSSLRGIGDKALRQSRRLGYSRIMLGDITNPKKGKGPPGFAATFARHPKIEGTPYIVAAAAATSGAAGRAVDLAVFKSMTTIF